jgi:hypothetical protein
LPICRISSSIDTSCKLLELWFLTVDQYTGEQAFAIAFAEGQRLTLDQALERALASATADSSPVP